MMPTSDIRTLTLHSSDAREAVTSAFEALEKWRDEAFAVNERHLTKALDLVAGSQRALGWPDHVATATREYLLKASKIQTQMISQVMDAWEKQLKSSATPRLSLRRSSSRCRRPMDRHSRGRICCDCRS
jgi:cellobiose-specific phosphotransferase system component IIA